jgi:outer membrane receptor for ferrienterochelin and colicin
MTLAAASVLLAVMLAAGPALGQATGRIAGEVVDADSGQPLPYANVSVMGTAYGSPTNALGQFEIGFIPVGTYVVQATYMGYDPQRIESVVITVDRTAEVNFRLNPVVLEADEVVVEAERPMIETEDTVTRRTMDKEEVKVRSITNVTEAIATQPGVVLHEGEIHVRGGRASEVKMYVDGIAITDAASGVGNLEVSLSSLSEFELLSGGFDAEYGNVQSGVINLQTREGGRSFSGEVRYMTDDYGAPERTYDNYDNLSFGMGGPLFTEKLRYYVSGEGRFSDTYLKTAEERPMNELWDGFLGIRARDRQSMLISGQAKISYFVTATKKLTGEFLTSRTKRDFYSHAYSRVGYWSPDKPFDLDGDGIYESRGHDDWSHVKLDDTYSYYNAAEHTPTEQTEFYQQKLVWRDNVSPTMFYTLRLAQFRSEEKYWLHEDPNDYWWEAYVGNTETSDPDSDNDLQLEPGYYHVWGDNLGWSQEITKATTIKADLTNQRSDTHQLKTGIEFVYNELDVKELSLRIPAARETTMMVTDPETGESIEVKDPSFQFFEWDEALYGDERNRHNIYRGFPSHGAMYLQDKMSYEGMIVRAGLRLDWSDPGPTSGIGERQIWRERVSAVVSPRLGIAHPISDRDALHFHYGRFYQMPHLTAYYSAGEDIGNLSGAIVGFSGLEPEVTTSYQFGAEHQFSQNVAMDITGFYRDVFGLLATEVYQREVNEGGDVWTYVNKDYASVRGVEFKLTKRFSNFFSGNFTYTWLQATGVSSDENQGAQQEAQGLPRQPLKEIPLDWDERHTITGFLFVSDPGNWEVTFDYNYGSGTPYTPRFLGQKEVQPEDMNSGRLPSHSILTLKGTKKYKLYGQEFRLFFEAVNVFDKKNVRRLGAYGAEYYTETGNLGGAFVESDAEGRERLQPLNDPSVYSEGRLIRVGVAIDW